MFHGVTVGVVIPAYRVAPFIGAVVAEMPSFVDQIFIVDDASPDDLAAVITSLRDPRVTLLRHTVNQGVGGATATGMKAALEAGMSIVVKCDGDGQMSPADIPRLLEPLVDGSADHAKGSRYLHSRELKSMPRWRFVGNVGLTFLTKLASGYWNILDPVNGFFATRAEVLRVIPLHLISRRYFFETDLLIRLNVFRAAVVDVPLPARYGDERSSLSPVRAMVDFPPRLIWGFAKRIFWRYIFFDVSPVAVFLVFAVLLLSFGVAFGTYQWVAHAIAGTAAPTGTVMLAAMPVLLGFQLLLQAIVLDIQNTPRARPRSNRVGDAAAFPVDEARSQYQAQ